MCYICDNQEKLAELSKDLNKTGDKLYDEKVVGEDLRNAAKDHDVTFKSIIVMFEVAVLSSELHLAATTRRKNLYRNLLIVATAAYILATVI